MLDQDGLFVSSLRNVQEPLDLWPGHESSLSLSADLQRASQGKFYLIRRLHRYGVFSCYQESMIGTLRFHLTIWRIDRDPTVDVSVVPADRLAGQ